MQAYEAHNQNIHHIFQHSTHGMEDWAKIKNFEARHLLNTKIDSENPVVKYLHQLKETTKLKPEGGFIRRPETTEHYIERALQWIAKYGDLEKVNK
jgi:hypothetical protein